MSDETSKSIVMVGADWCGYTQKAKEEMLPTGDFTYIDCALEANANNPFCQNVPGFPMFKTQDNQICFRGYGEVGKVREACIPRPVSVGGSAPSTAGTTAPP